MTLRRKSILVCGVIFTVVLSFYGYSVHRNLMPRLQMPKGISLEAVLDHDEGRVPKGWYTNATTFQRYSLAQELSGRRIGFRFKQFLGLDSIPVPNPARDVEMSFNLADCSGYSGEVYLLAREFFPDGYGYGGPTVDFNLAYTYGGTNRVRSARDWVALNEAGIVEHGVVAYRGKEPRPTKVGVPANEPFETNQCAVIRDTEGIVKIVPLSCLRAYRDAGLIELPTP